MERESKMKDREIVKALRALALADDQGDIALADQAGLIAKVKAALPRAPEVPSWGVLWTLATRDPSRVTAWRG